LLDHEIEERMDGTRDRFGVIALVGRQVAGPDEGTDLPVADLDRDAPQPLPGAVPATAPCGSPQERKDEGVNMLVNRKDLGPPGTSLPANAVYIGRRNPRYGLPASKWANPYRIARDDTRDEVIEKYRAWIVQQPDLIAALPELRGKDLVCWCAPESCHGAVLLELLEELGRREKGQRSKGTKRP